MNEAIVYLEEFLSSISSWELYEVSEGEGSLSFIGHISPTHWDALCLTFLQLEDQLDTVELHMCYMSYLNEEGELDKAFNINFFYDDENEFVEFTNELRSMANKASSKKSRKKFKRPSKRIKDREPSAVVQTDSNGHVTVKKMPLPISNPPFVYKDENDMHTYSSQIPFDEREFDTEGL